MLRAAVGVRVGDLDVDVELEVGAGEVVALLGPNGAGKTTVLRALAGLVPIERGRIELDGVVLDDPAAGTFVPIRERSIGVVFQDHLLFPRLSALDNVAFGLRARVGARRPRPGPRRRRGSSGSASALAPQRSRRALSGGAGAAGRAGPGAGDRAPAAPARRAPLRARRRHPGRGAQRAAPPPRRLRRQPALVTHDPVDALVLADRLVIVEDGRVVQVGTGAEVTARPGVALRGPTSSGSTCWRARPRGSGSSAWHPAPSWSSPTRCPARSVSVAVRPQAVALHADVPAGSARNAWPATVADLEADARPGAGEPRRARARDRRGHAGGGRRARPRPGSCRLGLGQGRRRHRLRALRREH